MKYIWDTNTVIYYLQQIFPERVEIFVDTLLDESPPAISSITEIELFSWKNATKTDVEMVEAFVNDSSIIELEKPVKIKAAEIRRLHSIKLPDAIIAASALVYDLTLITRNTKDFKNIEGLALVNPWDN
jgi:predicted nucleic acid-binding protein